MSHTEAQKIVSAYYGNLEPNSCYIRDVQETIETASKFLDDQLKEYRLTSATFQLAIVLDIDDTTLSNFISFEKDNFDNSPEGINKRYHQTDIPAITPVLDLYNKAIKENVAVFFVTARKPLDENEDLSPYIIKNLNNVGFKQWQALYLPRNEELKLANAVYKASVRQKISEAGYKIILNIGDQPSDFEGGYAEKTALIPNYLYGTTSLTTIPSLTQAESSTLNILKALKAKVDKRNAQSKELSVQPLEKFEPQKSITQEPHDAVSTLRIRVA